MAMLLAATLARTLPLADNRFHPDEALYAYFARQIASGRDPLLAGVLVDKPPLAFYLNGLAFVALGHSEVAARLPALFASVASVALVWALARRLYGPPTAQLAGWAMALSPFAILFSITVFTDPLLVAAGLACLWATAAGRTRRAGLALGLAFALKQTALLILPLAFGLALVRVAWAPAGHGWRWLARMLWAAAWPMLLGLALAGAAAYVWDAARQPAIGFWAQGYSDNIPGRLVRAREVLPRATAWAGLLGMASASPVVNAVALAGWPLVVALAPPRSRAGAYDRVLTLYLMVYLAAHWLLAFNVWDRYLLPLVPLLAVMVGRVLAGLGELAARAVARWRQYSEKGIAHPVSAGGRPPLVAMRRSARPIERFGSWPRLAIPLVVLISALARPAAQAAQSAYPIGGDHGAYAGIDQAAAFIHTLPSGSVLYDHWLSWQWNYYLFDGPVYVAWMPSPEALAADLRRFGHTSPRFVAVPAWEPVAEVRHAAGQADYGLEPRFIARRPDGSPAITVFELLPVGAAGGAKP